MIGNKIEGEFYKQKNRFKTLALYMFVSENLYWYA